MVTFRDFVGVDIAPVSIKTAVKGFLHNNRKQLLLFRDITTKSKKEGNPKLRLLTISIDKI